MGFGFGSLLGFGVGHAIQGRYWDQRGWTYTAIQGASLAGLVSGIDVCGTDGDACKAAVAIGAIGLFLGSKAWEISNLFKFTRQELEGGYPRFSGGAILPRPDGLSAVLTFRY